jgi:hypothetical protein
LQLQQIGGVVSVSFLLVLIETLCKPGAIPPALLRFHVKALWTCRKRLVKILGGQLAVFDRILRASCFASFVASFS